MKAEDWTALLVAIAGVATGLAAVPATSYRAFVLVAAVSLVLLALLIAVRPRRSAGPVFTIVTPTPDQGVHGGGVVVSGTVTDLDTDTLWVFEEGKIDGRRVWFFGGEALVDGNRWSFEYEPKGGTTARPRRTLSIVRADRNCERQLRGVRPDNAGRLVVYDPTPGGCEVLGQISIFLAGQP